MPHLEGEWREVARQSPALIRILQTLQQVCKRTFGGGAPTILIEGETGSGKGFIAKRIHQQGGRRGGPFVEVNCAALPPTLIESELFGHERGSFTDAKETRQGLFQEADGGTLFLDEIGCVPLDVQVKLLSAIEDKQVRRIGARQAARVDLQIVAATHRDLRQMIAEGSFRQDLFHRLNVIAVSIPPLRDRGRDVVLLAHAFLESACREYQMPLRRLSDDAEAWLMRYPWPGNVRELRNQIERIVLLEDEPEVRARHFRGADVASAAAAPVEETGLRISLPKKGVPLAHVEREVIREALAHCKGNVSRAARHLSISRQTMVYRMKKHRLCSGS
jgi:DNA-binding NtrC family response regulator